VETQITCIVSKNKTYTRTKYIFQLYYYRSQPYSVLLACWLIIFVNEFNQNGCVQNRVADTVTVKDTCPRLLIARYFIVSVSSPKTIIIKYDYLLCRCTRVLITLYLSWLVKMANVEPTNECYLNNK